MIKVCIYEDNQKLNKSLCQLVQSEKEFELVGSYQNCENIISNCAEFKPDVILMDIDMPMVNGIEGLKLIRPIYPNICVLMLTVFEENEKIFEAIQSGASGYLLKNSSVDEIIKAIYDVYNGGAPLSPFIAKKILNYHARMPIINKSSEVDKLSQREREVLELLSSGLSYKMIADKMNVSLDTVKTHLRKSYRKLEVHSAIEAIKKL